jgi:hypothetical protein
MKTVHCISLFATLLLVATAPGQTPELLRGKALLLDNDRVLEGDIEKVETQYRVKRTVGELWLPASRVKKLCKDVGECYDAMKAQLNLKDADERLKLARWCQVNGMSNYAFLEAKAALDMRPEHKESISLVQMLERVSITSATTPARPKATPAPQPPPIARGTSVDISNEAFATFATRVQPILMNTCVSCHSNGRGGAFQLLRVSDGGHRASAQGNLKIVLEFVNVEKPALSPLLIKSVVAHGGVPTPPIKNRQAVPFQTLQSWVEQLVESNPHLKEMRAEGTGISTSAKKDFTIDWSATDRPSLPIMPALPPVAAPFTSAVGPRVPGKSDGEIVSKPAPIVRPEPATAPQPKLTTPPPSVLPSAPRDPFDPAEFNSRPK